MTDPHDELVRRQLADARARENSAIFRRVLGLIVGAGLLFAIGSQRPADMPIAIAAAVALLVAAAVVAWRGDLLRR